MADGFRSDRRTFLCKSAVAVAGATALPLAAARGAFAGAGELNLVGADHVGLTVPDISEAVSWFPVSNTNHRAHET
jgi:hypothetical protein